MIAITPVPPYYAVIFTSIKTDSDNENYLKTALLMEELAQLNKGYLGIESARDKLGITVSYWKDLSSIKQWKDQLDHKIAQDLGRTRWYSTYKVRIARVERDYDFEN